MKRSEKGLDLAEESGRKIARNDRGKSGDLRYTNRNQELLKRVLKETKSVW